MHDALLLLSRWMSKHLQDLWARIIPAVLLSPGLALAHGDDDVTAATFIGPIVALLVIVTVVGLGKIFLRIMVRRG